MRFTWTRKDLNEATVYILLRSLISERMSDVTNVYSPLSRKLHQLDNWLEHNRESLDGIPPEFMRGGKLDQV